MTSSEGLIENNMNETTLTTDSLKTTITIKQEEIVLDGNDSDCVLVEINEDGQNIDDCIPINKNGDNESQKENDVVEVEVDKEEKTINDNSNGTVEVMDVEKQSQDLENEISTLTSIVRDEIDITLDSAELEILDERVENSLNAELENVENGSNVEEKHNEESNKIIFEHQTILT